jgi:3-deoxy-manno-octulosonate cytidylyltransferase (CMP-KDO synthetase)
LSQRLTATVVIPARFGSTSFPDKILASRTGRPLVQHVVESVRECRFVSDIIVATDDQRIIDALKPFGTRCVVTDPNHPSGTDRVSEAVSKTHDTSEIIVNVQGDEPEIEPQTIDTLIRLLADESTGGYEMWTAATPLQPPANPQDPNLVKVVLSRTSRAMYFSRAPIPYHRDQTKEAPPTYYLHVGVYAYLRTTLLRLSSWKPTPCEIAEKLEQLRALEHDVPIGVTVIDRATHGIDTPEQYDEFVQRFQKDA